jgi:hypothetical protein
MTNWHSTCAVWAGCVGTNVRFLLSSIETIYRTWITPGNHPLLPNTSVELLIRAFTVYESLRTQHVLATTSSKTRSMLAHAGDWSETEPIAFTLRLGSESPAQNIAGAVRYAVNSNLTGTGRPSLRPSTAKIAYDLACRWPLSTPPILSHNQQLSCHQTLQVYSISYKYTMVGKHNPADPSHSLLVKFSSQKKYSTWHRKQTPRDLSEHWISFQSTNLQKVSVIEEKQEKSRKWELCNTWSTESTY